MALQATDSDVEHPWAPLVDPGRLVAHHERPGADQMSGVRGLVGLSPVTGLHRRFGAVQSVEAALKLARMAGQSDNRAELEAKLAANPGDLQARFDLAIAMAARGRKAEALDHLLDIVRRDRNWNEQAARKQLVQLFDAWGPKDPLTNEGRRRLSALLFA